MDKRIKQIRKSLGLTQQEFADKIGISRGNIGAYEVGKNSPSDAVISLICTKFSVNEDWLRNGTGEMFVELDIEGQLLEWAGKALNGRDANFKTYSSAVSKKIDVSSLKANWFSPSPRMMFVIKPFRVSAWIFSVWVFVGKASLSASSTFCFGNPALLLLSLIDLFANSIISLT